MSLVFEDLVSGSEPNLENLQTQLVDDRAESTCCTTWKLAKSAISRRSHWNLIIVNKGNGRHSPRMARACRSDLGAEPWPSSD